MANVIIATQQEIISIDKSSILSIGDADVAKELILIQAERMLRRKASGNFKTILGNVIDDLYNNQ